MERTQSHPPAPTAPTLAHKPYGWLDHGLGAATGAAAACHQGSAAVPPPPTLSASLLGLLTRGNTLSSTCIPCKPHLCDDVPGDDARKAAARGQHPCTLGSAPRDHRLHQRALRHVQARGHGWASHLRGCCMGGRRSGEVFPRVLHRHVCVRKGVCARMLVHVWARFVGKFWRRDGRGMRATASQCMRPHPVWTVLSKYLCACASVCMHACERVQENEHR